MHFDVDVFAGHSALPMLTVGQNLRVSQFANPILPKRCISNCFNLPKQLRQYVAVFDLSEGDSFADIYGWRRAYINSIQKILAARSGVPMVVAPMTIGPFKRAVWGRLASNALRGSQLVYARDLKSADCARSLGCSHVNLATDLAMALPYDRVTHLAESEATVHVGVNVSGLLWSEGYSGRNEFGIKSNYKDTMTRVIERLSREPNVCVHLVPHVLSATAVEDDRIPSRALQDKFPSCRIAPNFKGSVEAKNYISGLDLFLGSRMHACIAAFSSGVPTLPLAYSMKFEGLFGSLGYDRTVDLCVANEDEVLSALELSLSERILMQDEVRLASGKAKALLAQYSESVTNLLSARI